MFKNKNIFHLFLIPLAMFGFGYLMVPIYNVFCDITGLNGKTGRVNQAVVEQMQVDESRLIKVEFDSSLNQRAKWAFKSEVKSMMVKPGQPYQAYYTAINQQNKAVVGQAIPSLAPARAASYFNKTECFCFTQQKFKAYEAKSMPLVFVVDPSLPEDISTVTLSYTFFDVDNPIISKSKEAI